MSTIAPRTPTTRRVAAAALGLTTALGVGGIALLAMTPRDQVPPGSRPEETMPYFAMQLAFAIVGAVVLWRRPRNSIGWALMGVAFVSSVEFAGIGYGLYGLRGPIELPLAAAALWLYAWAGIAIMPFAAWIVLAFPDGRPATRRATAALVLVTVGVLLVIASFLFRPGDLLYLRGVTNPFGRTGLEPIMQVSLALGILFVLSALGLAIVAMRERFASARGVERQQFKWLLAALAVNVIVFVPTVPFVLELTGEPVVRYVARVLAFGSLAGLPIAVGVAILRHRLYDIDLLVNRAIVYGSLSAMLAGTYVALVVLAQGLLRPLTGGSEIAVAASTLATLAIVQPLRSRIQDTIDRRLYRSRYDAVRTLDAFSGRLRDEVDLDALRADMLDVVGETLRPTHAGVWLRAGR